MCAMLEATIYDDDGTNQHLCWLAESTNGLQNRLHWEVRRVSGTVGYKMDQKRSPVCSIMNNLQPIFANICNRYGWSIDDCVGHSLHSQRSKSLPSDEPSQTLSQEYWIDTRLLLAMLLHWQTHQTPAKREFIKACVPQLLSRFLSGLSTDDFTVDQASGDMVRMCRRRCTTETDLCVCAESAVRAVELSEDSASVHWKIWSHIAALAVTVEACKTTAAMCASAFARLTNMILANAEQWKTQDIMKSSGAILTKPNGKRLRLSECLKEAVVRDAVVNGRSQKTSSLVQVMEFGTHCMGIRLTDEALADLHAASRLTFRKPMVMSYCLDAAQIGKPHRDILVTAQYAYPINQDIVMAPKALV